MTEPKTPLPELTPEEKAEEERVALARATAILQRTIASPLEVAQENAELRSSIKGAYALMHVMVKRLGGKVEVPFADHSNIPDSDGDLQIARDPKTGDITLRLHKPNRAERRGKA